MNAGIQIRSVGPPQRELLIAVYDRFDPLGLFCLAIKSDQNGSNPVLTAHHQSALTDHAHWDYGLIDVTDRSHH
jgi:hypothetical protein